MTSFPPPRGDFSGLARVLKTRSAAVRDEEDLGCIRAHLDPSLGAADVVWAALSARQKLVLCKFFELHTVFESEGQVKCVEKGAGGAAVGTGSLYLLVHGRATVSIRGGPSLSVRSGGEGSQLWPVLGRLPIPSKDAKSFFRTSGAIESVYHRFVTTLIRKESDVTIHFEKGATYIVLPETQSRHYLLRLDASLIANRVFSDIGIARLLRHRRHQKECGYQLLDGEIRPTKVFQFRAGQILMKEGDDPERVLFIATGSCLVLRSNEEQEVHCVGSTLSPCLIGISTLFLGDDSNGLQPVSVVAAKDGFCFSCCSNCFLAFVKSASAKNSELNNAFVALSLSQMTAWATQTAAVVEDGEEGALATESDTEELEELDPQTFNIDEEVGIQEGESGNTAKDTSDRKEILVHTVVSATAGTLAHNEPDSSELPGDVGILTNAAAIGEQSCIEQMLQGKLNRSKLLSTLHQTLSVNVCANRAAERERDFVCDRQKWLLDGDKGNILADVMTALSEGCGVDFTKCEGSDPFHDFAIDEATETDECHMSIQMPAQMQNRLDRMTENCLGRTRPPEYDDSDPFLKPCPSFVSRKMHGKTLPVVRRVGAARVKSTQPPK